MINPHIQEAIAQKLQNNPLYQITYWLGELSGQGNLVLYGQLLASVFSNTGLLV